MVGATGFVRIGTTTIPYLTKVTGMTGEALALNSAFGAGTGYLSAKAQGKSDTVTTAQTVWGAVSPLLGAGIVERYRGTLAAELGAGALTGGFGNLLTQSIETTWEDKPFSPVDLMVSTGLGSANSGYTRFMTRGLSAAQKNHLATQFSIYISNPIPWVDLSQSRILDAYRESAKLSGTNGRK